MPTPAQIREELLDLTMRDLLGPVGGENEIVEIADIRSRYLVGMLAPKGQLPLPEDQEMEDNPTAGVDTEDGVTEARPLRMGAGMLPSSIGLSFVVDGAATHLQITARWGWYERVKNTKTAEETVGRRLENVWLRHPVEVISPPVPLRPGRLDTWRPNPARPDVFVDGLVRERSGQWHITLYLVNGQEESEQNKGTVWLFQPQLVVKSPDGAPIFEKRVDTRPLDDPELAGLAMRYRRRLEFAVGHGVAVNAKPLPGTPERALQLCTEVAPQFEMPVAEPPTVEEIPGLEGLELDMRRLAETPDGHYGACLTPLTDAYAAWIATLRVRMGSEADLAAHAQAAAMVMSDSEKTLRRIRAGIALLDSEPNAAAAFRFANRAMADQRVHSIYTRSVRQGGTASLEEIEAHRANHTWRIFQLAFILLNLCGTTEPTHDDRNLVADLLFFPTGGGKTEAYLGLAAYVMALRRLQGTVAGRSGHAGVAVLMRYTLRLLTLQQFQRAATLICACELIRRDDPAIWGAEPFRVGLWVGARTTPNDTNSSAQVIENLHVGGWSGGSGTPHQLSNCPWCGRKIEPSRDIKVETFEKGHGRTLVYCGDPLGECPFSVRQAAGEGLPVLTVDEEIYRRLPALLIATVDKFAQMPWNGRTAMLFGQVTGFCERHGYRSPDLDDTDTHPASKKHRLLAAHTIQVPPLRPPDLIIQDELHLISGPLGSLVGLYETAVDELCTWEVDSKTVRPKVIASTATIRQANMQVASLFMRRLHVFPSPGLDAEDSFFARERSPVETPGRRYIGICAPGIRHRTALIRIYTTLLSAAQKLYLEYGRDVDPWMTLVGYFNSLRELGAMRRAVDDSVTARLGRMDKLGLARRSLSPWSVTELTSRLDATQIPEILDHLELVFEPVDKEATKPWAADKGKKRPLDVLLATNMISVGVDVSRLGLMVVASQPKNTAEYIQSTSRVGRTASGPGVVFVAYNWTRPRDLSHYETFAHYHATAYQHVEALSVTPFSKGAIYRGLSGVLAAQIRLMGMDLNRNDGAGTFSRTHAYAQKAIKSIVKRAESIEGPVSGERLRQEVQARLDTWADRVTNTPGATLVYRKRSGTQSPLLRRPEEGPWERFTCLNSLRDVEPPANLILWENIIPADRERAWKYGASGEESGGSVDEA